MCVANKFTEPKSDAPEKLRRKRLKKGAIPNLNLCGNSADECVSKRKTLASMKAAMPITSPTASMAVLEADSKSTLLLSDVAQPEGYWVGFEELETDFLELRSIKAKLATAEDKNFQLQKSCFSCSNLSDNDVIWYKGLRRPFFNCLVRLIDRLSF